MGTAVLIIVCGCSKKKRARRWFGASNDGGYARGAEQLAASGAFDECFLACAKRGLMPLREANVCKDKPPSAEPSLLKRAFWSHDVSRALDAAIPAPRRLSIYARGAPAIQLAAQFPEAELLYTGE